MGKILKLLERWDGPRNEYWIGVEPIAAHTYHMGPTVMLGPQCMTLADLEQVATQIRADLDEILSEAKSNIQAHNKS